MESPIEQWNKVNSDDYFSVDKNGKTLIEQHRLTLESFDGLILEEGLSSDTIRVNTTDDKVTRALVKDIVDNQEVSTTAHVIFTTDLSPTSTSRANFEDNSERISVRVMRTSCQSGEPLQTDNSPNIS